MITRRETARKEYFQTWSAKPTRTAETFLGYQPVEKVELDQYERQRKRSAAVARSGRQPDQMPQGVGNTNFAFPIEPRQNWHGRGYAASVANSLV